MGQCTYHEEIEKDRNIGHCNQHGREVDISEEGCEGCPNLTQAPVLPEGSFRCGSAGEYISSESEYCCPCKFYKEAER